MYQHNLNIINNDSTLQYTQETQMTNVASQTSPSKGIKPQNHVIATEQPPGNQTGNEPLQFLSCSKNCPTDIQESEKHTLTNFIGVSTILPLTTATPLIEKRLVRDEQTNEMYLPITSTVVIKWKQEVPYVPLDFENNLTVDIFVDSRAYVSALTQNGLDPKRNKKLRIIFPNSTTLPKFKNNQQMTSFARTVTNNHP